MVMANYYLAILSAVRAMRKNRSLSIANLFSDSRSSLQALSDPESCHPLVYKIREEIRDLEADGGKIHLFWIRAHAGIEGNERADELAKEAALRDKRRPVYDRFPLSVARRLVRQNTLAVYQAIYEGSATGRVTKTFFPTIGEAYAFLGTFRMDNIYAQIFTGHGGFKHYLHRFKLIESPQCPCGEDDQTVIHVLVHCDRHMCERLHCEAELGVQIEEASLRNIIADREKVDVFLRFAREIVIRINKENGATGIG